MPYFAGTIIAYSANSVPKGVLEIQTYWYATRIKGFYNSDSKLISDRNIQQYELEIALAYGLTSFFDFNIEVYGFITHNNNKEIVQFGDIFSYLGFQLLKIGPDNPGIRFLLGGIFPSGKYQNLDPTFKGGDGVGLGAYQTLLALLMERVYENGKHPFNWKINLYYILSSKTDVSGINAYFVDFPNVDGVVSPGVQFKADFALEYKYNKQWGSGLDVFISQQNSSSFFDKSGRAPRVDIPSWYTLSLAPSLEYNVSEKLAMLAGVWFSVAGRNALAFTSFIYSLYYEF